MRQRSLLTAAVAPLVVIAAIAGCQGPAPVVPAPVAPAAEAGYGTIEIDMASVRSLFGDRRVQSHDGPNDPATTVTKMAIKVYAFGMSPVEAVIPYTDSDHEPPVATEADPLATFSLNVPAGHNRVFVVKGLNAQNAVLHQFHSLGSVQAGSALTVKLSAMHDAAARALLDLMGPTPAGQTDPTGFPSALAGSDYTAALLDFVQRTTGYDPASNSYSGFSPTNFRSRNLALNLRQAGKTFLAADPPATSPLLVEGSGEGTVTVINYDQPWPYPLEIEVRTPAKRKAGEASAITTFSDLPPGEWDVLVKSGSRVAWTRMRIGEFGDGQDVTATLPVGVLPESPHVIYEGGFGANWSAQGSSGVTMTTNSTLHPYPNEQANPAQAPLAVTFPATGGHVDVRLSSPLDVGLFRELELSVRTASETYAEFAVQLTDGQSPLGEARTFYSEGFGYEPRYFAIGSDGYPKGVYKVQVLSQMGEGFNVDTDARPLIKGFRIKPVSTLTGPMTLYIGRAAYQPSEGGYVE